MECQVVGHVKPENGPWGITTPGAFFNSKYPVSVVMRELPPPPGIGGQSGPTVLSKLEGVSGCPAIPILALDEI